MTFLSFRSIVILGVYTARANHFDIAFGKDAAKRKTRRRGLSKKCSALKTLVFLLGAFTVWRVKYEISKRIERK